MTPRSALLPRFVAPLLLALAAPLPGFAQTAGATAGAQATPAQATSPAATPHQTGASVAPTGTAPRATAPVGTAPTAGTPAATAPAAASTSGAPAANPAYTGPGYDVEIVIFRARTALGQPENWAAETSASATVAGGETATGSGSEGKLLAVLPTSEYRLTYLASRLRTSGTYEPVAHAAWVQTAGAWGTHAGLSLDSLGIDVPGLTGVIFLERGQFLHLGMTLNYTMQDPPPGLSAPPGTTFVMNEDRRVRFYQRNYYDHPAFGVIALVMPARGPRPPGR